MLDFLNLIAVLFVNFITILIIALRYRYVLRHIDRKIGRVSSFLIICISNSINYLAPFKIGIFIGNPIAGKLREKISIQKSSVILIFDQVFELIWQLVLILAVIYFTSLNVLELSFLFRIIFVGLLIFLLIFFIIYYKLLIKVVLNIFPFLPNKFKNLLRNLGIKKEGLDGVFGELKSLFTEKRFIINYFFRTACLILVTPISLFLLARAFSFDLSYIYALVIFWVSSALGKLGGLPGGLGVRDAIQGAFLVGLGIPLLGAAKIVFYLRVLGFFPALPIGLFLLFFLGKDKILNLFERFDKSGEL